MTKVIDESVKCYKEEALENPKTVVKQEKLKIIFTEALLKKKLPSQNLIKSVQNFKKKMYYIRELVLFSTILNCNIPGIVLSEFVLSGDPLYPI